MSQLVINFTEMGTVDSLHMDGFDLGFLGGRSIRRQGDIWFNVPTQTWEVQYLDGDKQTLIAIDFTSYEKAREFEVAFFNECRFLGVDPISDNGKRISNEVRRLLG